MQAATKPAQTYPSQVLFTKADVANMAKSMCRGICGWNEREARRICKEAVKAFNIGKTYYAYDRGLSWDGGRRFFFQFTLKAGKVVIEHGYCLFVDDDEVPYLDVLAEYTK